MVDFIKYAFVGGEIAPKLIGRSDLEKYDLGLALAQNWYVDYHGGLSTRPGQRFIDFVKTPDEATKFFPFRFGPTTSQTYALLFGHNYIRFVQDGDYVLEAAKAITGISYTPLTLVTTSGAHGYAVGDWVRLTDITGLTTLFNERTFEVATVPSATTFSLIDPKTGAGLATFPVTGVTGNAKRIYTVATTYNGDDLAELRASQSRSVVYLTHPSFPVKKLTRVAHTNWTLAAETFGTTLAAPNITGYVKSAIGTAGVGFVVTAVDEDGQESLPSIMKMDTNVVDYTTTAGQVRISWPAVAGAVRYNVYRTQLVVTGADTNRAMQVGFIGYAFAPDFIDRGITPDFTITPPNNHNPFALGAVSFINVTAPGAGYTSASVVSITSGTGTGFVGSAAINAAGNLIGIIIDNEGAGYTTGDTVVVTVGAGATFTIEVTSSTGRYPRTSGVFQQRRAYAGSDESPLTVWASKPGLQNIFDVSDIVQQDDSYEFELDSEEVAPITHLLATRSGLVIMSQAGVSQLTGGNDRAVTATNALADTQTYVGVSPLKPLPIDTDVLFVEGKGGAVRLLVYNDFTKLFQSQDISILSNHLVAPPRTMDAWAYAADPDKTVIGIRDDGVATCLTIVKEQNVYGWTRFQTRGYYRDVVCLQEGNVDAVYLVVERILNGHTVKCLETQVRREFTSIEDAFFLDCALSLNVNYGTGTIFLSAETGTVTITLSGGTFSSGNVGDFIRAGSGKAIITAYTDATHVTARVLQDFPLIPESTTPATHTDWTIDTPVSSVSGLWHLEGMEIYGVLDGNVVGPVTVALGIANFGSVEFTRATLGILYTCIAQTLPPTSTQAVLDNKPKAPKSVYMRVFDARGLKAGADLDYLYPMDEVADPILTEPIPLQSGMHRAVIQSSHNFEGQFYVVQDLPLPATILSLSPTIDIPSAQRKSG